MGFILFFLSLVGLALVVVSYLRVSVSFGAIVVAIIIDAAAFLHFFVPTAANSVAVGSALALAILVALLVREWKKMPGR